MSALAEMYRAICSLSDPVAREGQLAARCGQMAAAIKEDALVSGAMERDFIVVLHGRDRQKAQRLTQHRRVGFSVDQHRNPARVDDIAKLIDLLPGGASILFTTPTGALRLDCDEQTHHRANHLGCDPHRHAADPIGDAVDAHASLDGRV